MDETSNSSSLARDDDATALDHDEPAAREKPVDATATATSTAKADGLKAPSLQGRIESFGDVVKDTYFNIDRRTLGLTRICLGWFAIGDLFRRTPDWIHMFGDTGVQPTVLILQRPQSGSFTFLDSFSENWELWTLWAVIFATYVCLLLGFKTKLMQILSLLWVTSMNGRVLLIENGGYVVHNLLLLWTCFMPLGDRFSLDAMISSWKRKREKNAYDLNDRTDVIEPYKLKPFTSVVCLVVLLQFSAIYYFNKLHKTGPAWSFQTPQAVHFVMYVDRMVNPLIAHARTHIPFFVFEQMTRAVLFSEMVLAYLFLTPFPKVWARRFALVLVNFLHIGFGSTFVLGPFAWALCVLGTLLFQREDWELANRTMRRTHRARTVIYDPTSGAAFTFCRFVKRMDLYDLLAFDEAEGLERKAGIVVERANGSQVTGPQALREIVATFPVGPVFAWMITLPGVRALVASLMQRGRWSRFFALPTADDKPEVDRSVVPIWNQVGALRRFGREMLVLTMFVGAVNQALTELWVTKTRWSTFIADENKSDFMKKHGIVLSTQPEMTQVLSQKLRFLQGWFMFSPNPVMDDGTIVVDAVTVDGRHVDPFWNTPPNFDLIHAQSFGYNQIWSDYFNRMHLPGNRQYRDAMVDYMRRLPDRTGNPNDALASGEVYWVHDNNPRWRTTESYGQGQDLLFTFGADGGAKDPPPSAAPKPAE